MDNETQKTNIKSILITLIITIAVVGLGTYAWLTYRSKNTAMVLTIGDLNNVQITLKPYQLDLTLDPMLTYGSLDTSGDYVTVSVVNNSTTNQKFNLYYDISQIDSGLQNSNFRYTIVRQSDNNTTEGNFANATTTSNFYILEKATIPANTTYNYKVYTWLYGDGNQSSGLVFKGDLRAEILEPCKELTTPPVLDDGMIPVTIANDGTVTTVASSDSTWYNYCEQKWANAVLVKESGVKTRAGNKVAGTVINQGDILAYYVWIPRYSYKIWTLDASQTHTGDEQAINIKFVDINTKENGSAVGSYYTHPAFTFGTEELPGFWVGKFESSTNTTSTCYISISESNCDNTNQEPRIVPNVKTLIYQTVSNQFATSLKFAGGTQSGSTVTFAGNSTYGLTASVDSHMMKNSEWGAVAYLSHSNYGINDEIRKNNYYVSNKYENKTGCGANAENANTETAVTTCAIPYGTVSGETNTYPQSTTGNISGVFDMSGGASEYVMGNFNGTIRSSGFSTFPASKYYDVYLSSQFTGDHITNMTFCTLATCGGHALHETAGWYNDTALFVYSNHPWLERGGYSILKWSVGAFYSRYLNGRATTNSWRSVLVAR